MKEKVVVGPLPDMTPLDDGWSHLTEIVDKMVESGYVLKAETLEELAEMTCMNCHKLESTMACYNQHVANGLDNCFGKRSCHLYPMDEGPYYAFKVSSNNPCTIGGLQINSDFQVLLYQSEKGLTPIKNLYAAGADAAGIYSSSYSHTIEGAAQAWAYNSGRLAGAKATENALQIKIELE